MIERIFIGMDVHARTVVACAVGTATGEVILTKMNTDPVDTCLHGAGPQHSGF